MSSPRPSRREREQKFRSDLVLDAAEAVFAAHGFQGASMEEIARRAELSVGSLYNVFPSKDALLAGVVERRQEEFLAGATAQAATESPPLRRLDLLLLFAFDYFEAHEKLFELYVAATSGLLWHVRSSLGESTFSGTFASSGSSPRRCETACVARDGHASIRTAPPGSSWPCSTHS